MSTARQTEPWQTAEIPGPKKALVINNPQIVSALIKRSKNPMLISGYKTAEIRLNSGALIDYVIRIAELGDMSIVSTPNIQSEFIKRGYTRVVGMPLVDIANRLADSSWMGLEGKGPYDLVLFIGFKYYTSWLILSGLKHFSPTLKTVSLDMYYQPHASWSFPNISQSEWEKNLEVIIKSLEVK
ncbi:MAG: CO dehydrogenase/acetyl-CoA synthase complex subunit epsilon [Candidatus Bathyarchaeia archaeon]|nr:CO dehydrogenase/acetyl-CoA synthase complex subunit epsilon [Candidatus Bathyarchaeota archaeon]